MSLMLDLPKETLKDWESSFLPTHSSISSPNLMPSPLPLPPSPTLLCNSPPERDQAPRGMPQRAFQGLVQGDRQEDEVWRIEPWVPETTCCAKQSSWSSFQHSVAGPPAYLWCPFPGGETEAWREKGRIAGQGRTQSPTLLTPVQDTSQPEPSWGQGWQLSHAPKLALLINWARTCEGN